MYVTFSRKLVSAMLPLTLLMAAGLSAAHPARATTTIIPITIDTTKSWDGVTSQGAWGEPDTATFGQTFMAPVGVSALKDFSVYLTQDSTSVNIPFKAYVYAWDGSEASGSALYASSTQHTGNLGSGFTSILTTPTSAVAVTPGAQYVLFLSTSGVQEAGAPIKLADFGFIGSDTYTGGQFVALSSGNDPSQFTVAVPWQTSTDLSLPTGSDLAFKADFIPANGAPEPAPTVALALMGLGLAFFLLRRSRKTQMLAAAPAVLCLALAGGLTPAAQAVGTWTSVTTQAPQNISTMLLLTDGRVMAQGDQDRTWYTLTPDSHGSYVNGTWSQLASMVTKRLYYTSAVLRNGDVLISGGEYSATGTGGVAANDTNTSEIYHTQTDTWGTVPIPKHRNGSSWSNIGDAMSTTLADGRVMLGDILSSEQALYDYNTNAWTPSANLKAVRSNEEAWSLQSDGSVLTVDCIGQTDTGTTPEHAERYLPGSDSWLDAGSTPTGHSLVDNKSKELGPGMLLPIGSTLYIGATGHTALYSAANGWVPGPEQYGTSSTLLLGAPDAPGCVEVNGKALCFVSPASTSTSSFPNGQHFLEYTYDTSASNGSFAEAPIPPANVFNPNGPSFVGRLLQLPNGQVLFTVGQSRLFAYTPDSGPLAAWAPSVISLSARTDGSYLLKGKQFNGLTQGAYYGDDAQMATNYPLVRLTDDSSAVSYGRTYNHSTMGVASGSTLVSTTFVPPPALAQGHYTLEVVANGIASVPMDFTQPLGLASLTLSTASATGGTPVVGTVTLNGNSTGQRVALSTNSSAAVPAVQYVTIPAGFPSAQFVVNTSTVTATTPVTIKAIQGRQVRSATFSVTP